MAVAAVAASVPTGELVCSRAGGVPSSITTASEASNSRITDDRGVDMLLLCAAYELSLGEALRAVGLGELTGVSVRFEGGVIS